MKAKIVKKGKPWLWHKESDQGVESVFCGPTLKKECGTDCEQCSASKRDRR